MDFEYLRNLPPGDSFYERYTARCVNVVNKFKDNLIRQLIPEGMSDEDALIFLEKEMVSFVEYPDGKQEFWVSGKKMGDVFIGMESTDDGGTHFVARFTPEKQGETPIEIPSQIPYT